MKLSIRVKESNHFIVRSFKIMERVDRRKIILISLVQSLLGILDLVGVALIGILTALAVNGVRARPAGDRVSSILNLIHLSNLNIEKQVAILGTLSFITLVGRTLLTMYFTRKTLRFLSRISSNITANLVSKLLVQSILKIQSKTISENSYTLTGGVTSIVLGFISVGVSLIADISILLVMFTGLLLLNIEIAISSILIFSLIGISLYWLQQKRATKISEEFTTKLIERDMKIMEVLIAYRELVVRNRRTNYSNEIKNKSFEIANLQAEISFLPQISKYVIEIVVVAGTFLITAFQFAFQDISRAVATLAIFTVAATRIAPSVIRIQQSILLMRLSSTASSSTLDLIEELKDVPLTYSPESDFTSTHSNFKAEVVVDKISFAYPMASKIAISDISFTIAKGEIVAVVGPSGAGKTTLIDLILGVLIPDEGKIEISGISPQNAVKNWPGAIAYVPQDSLIVNGSFRENVSLGYPTSFASDDLIIEALQVAQLDNFVLSLPKKLDSQVGERGTKISGGQRQRLGIARAMFTKPALLVLDEATSALDGDTEEKISSEINGLKGSVTVLIIAHRLSTIKNADKVLYVENGILRSIGTFEEVCKTVPDFMRQAKLLGVRQDE